jgi:hypothetical protein
LSEASLAPRMGIARYHAMNYKTINSMAMIHILPAPAMPLVRLHRPNGMFANNHPASLTRYSSIESLFMDLSSAA